MKQKSHFYILISDSAKKSNNHIIKLEQANEQLSRGHNTRPNKPLYVCNTKNTKISIDSMLVNAKTSHFSLSTASSLALASINKRTTGKRPFIAAR